MFLLYKIKLPCENYENIPTASSAQIISKTNKIIPHNKIDFPNGLTFLMVISHAIDVVNNSVPAAIKSKSDQFTSVVNCIATKGANKIRAAKE
jgi:hypothetical protein